MKKKITSVLALCLTAFALTSCCCNNDPCCDPCPKPCYTRPVCPKPCCPRPLPRPCPAPCESGY
ncbi:hypothetical protein [Parachlamydia acanthamoebae]|uniref:hypothetical protein n=1 Tax=Parachlamydia acanthamoebae TaxID=83552 RepID=UPI00139F2C9D|nr:hypothetical protein [Parachlamydia acanthamoebae]